jgi:multiple sugar transport system permease protein
VTPSRALAEAQAWRPASRESGAIARLFDWKPFLIFLCMLPCLGLLFVFLTYPLGLGVWLAFTDTQIGRDGEFVGLFNYELLWEDNVFWLSVFNTLVYTIIATFGKFALGLWLALLLNNNLPLKSILRAIILVPFIVPTVLSAIAFWWIYDPQFSIISYVLVDVLGWRDAYIDFLGTPWNARLSLIVANIWRGIPSSRSPCWPGSRPSPPRSTRRRCWTGPRRRSGSGTSPSRC